MQIFVGSTNPVKTNAVIQAASETWPDVRVKGFSVPSGVSDQPFGDEETEKGSINRAKAALYDGLQESEGDDSSDYLGVGLEGGVFEKYPGELWSTVWVSVVDQDGSVVSSNGARFKVPEVIAQKILEGEEMGPVVAELIGESDVRKKQGMIGVITEGFVDRTEEYSGITKMALGLWYGREWDRRL